MSQLNGIDCMGDPLPEKYYNINIEGLSGELQKARELQKSRPSQRRSQKSFTDKHKNILSLKDN